MRTRTEGAKTNPTGLRGSRSRSAGYSPEDGPPPRLTVTPSIITSGSRTNVKTMTDVITPGYFKKSKGGDLVVNPCSSVQESFEGSNAGSLYVMRDVPLASGGIRRTENISIRTGESLNQPSGYIPDPPQIPSGPLLVDALSKAREDLWDAGTTAAEMGKTVEMLTGFQAKNFKRMEDILSDMRKKRRTKRASLALLADEFSSLWLSGRYGWRPTMYEYESITKHVERTLSGPFNRSRGYSEKTSESSHNTAWATYGNAWEYRWETTSTRTKRAFVRLGLSGNSAYIDPFVTAWELVPFSFVVDWFLNIGANISAFSPTATGSVLSAGVSDEIVRTRVLKTRVTGDWQVVNHQPPNFQCTTRIYTREPQKPEFSFAVDIKFDSFKATDLLFLTYKAIARKSRVFAQIVGASSKPTK